VGGLLGRRPGIRAPGALLEVLNDIEVVDHHAHGIVPAPPTLDGFRGLFSESADPRQWPHVATSVTYRRAIGELARLLGCEATEEGVFGHRRRSDPRDYAATLLRSSRSEWIFVDDGFPPPGEGEGWEGIGELAGCRSAPVMRIERVGEEGLAAGLGIDELRAHVRDEVTAAPARGYVALKTIAAYRSGLDVGDPNERGAAKALATRPSRLEAKPLLDLLLHDALEANEAAPLPVQVHCGFGDGDALLPRADPGYLKPVIERYRTTPFALLHCYPFVREGGWLAHVYANVFFDLSLTIPHVSRPAAALREALELAPVSKLLYASDASRAPELYYLASKWWREALAEVLVDALPEGEREAAARRVLRENALGLYEPELVTVAPPAP
jgi:uncharacterized protein